MITIVIKTKTARQKHAKRLFLRTVVHITSQRKSRRHPRKSK